MEDMQDMRCRFGDGGGLFGCSTPLVTLTSHWKVPEDTLTQIQRNVLKSTSQKGKEMTKWRWRWPAILMVSAAIWFILGLAVWTAWAGGLEEAAIRAVDRSACNFQVDQRIINSALYVGAIERNLTNKEAFDMAVQLTATLQQQVQESGRVRDYCIARMGQ